MSVSLEIVVRLFFSLICIFEHSAIRLYKVKRQINPHLRIDGILMTMVMPRTNISREITATVKSAYGQRIKVFDTQIPHSIRAVEATAEGKSIFAYDKGGKVAAAYEQFGKEVAELGEKQRKQNRADRIR